MAMATLFVSVLLVFVQTFATAQDFSATCGTQSFPATCSEGAPQDFDKTCRNGIFEADHVFPEERKILLDTYDYESLPDYWTLTSFDNDANQVYFGMKLYLLQALHVPKGREGEREKRACS